MNRSGHPILEPSLTAAREMLLLILRDELLRGRVVADNPLDLDQAAQTALDHIDAARELLSPFFLCDFAVGDVADVAETDDNGYDHTVMTNVRIINIQGREPLPTAIVKDQRGRTHKIPGHKIRVQR